MASQASQSSAGPAAPPPRRPRSALVGAVRRHEGLVAGHDLLAQRCQGHRDHLQVGDGQRDADDGERLRDRGDDVGDDQPDARDHDPDDVADHRRGPGRGLADDRPAERPEDVVGDAERGDPPRDRDDEDEADDAGHHVGEREPDPAEQQPDHVEHESEESHDPMMPGAARPRTAGRRLRWRHLAVPHSPRDRSVLHTARG